MNRSMTCAATAALILAAAGAAMAAPAKKTAAPASGPVATQPTAPAAARPASPPPPPLTHGPPIAGLCVYSDDGAMGGSLVGRAAAARLKQLQAQVAAELQGEDTVIVTDANALIAKKATLTPDQFQAQAAPIQARKDAWNAKAALRQRELEATGQEASQQIHQRIDGILRGIYQQRACSILLRGEAVAAVNPAMDLTPAVVTQLDVAMPTITFDRKVLPAQGAPQ
jgi:outer membrane protein